MDYSIRDALEAGFNKIVFIIRKDLEEEFKSTIGARVEKIAEVAYAYQEMEKLPEGFVKPADRTKPWGTGHGCYLRKRVPLQSHLQLSMQMTTMERKHT